MSARSAKLGRVEGTGEFWMREARPGGLLDGAGVIKMDNFSSDTRVFCDVWVIPDVGRVVYSRSVQLIRMVFVGDTSERLSATVWQTSSVGYHSKLDPALHGQWCADTFELAYLRTNAGGGS